MSLDCRAALAPCIAHRVPCNEGPRRRDFSEAGQLTGWHALPPLCLLIHCYCCPKLNSIVTDLQAIFFTPGSIQPYNSFKYMGCMIIGISLTHFLTYFPMWCGSTIHTTIRLRPSHTVIFCQALGRVAGGFSLCCVELISTFLENNASPGNCDAVDLWISSPS